MTEGYWIIDVTGPWPLDSSEVVVAKRAIPYLILAGWTPPHEPEP